MQIRPAKSADLHALTALARETFCDAFAFSFEKEDLARHLAEAMSEEAFAAAMERDTFLIADTGEMLAGFVQCGANALPVDEAPARAREICRLYVRRAFQNERLGARLMEAGLALPDMTGHEIYLGVWEHNLAGIRFYRRYGFEPVGRHRFPYCGSDDLIMRRRSASC